MNDTKVELQRSLAELVAAEPIADETTDLDRGIDPWEQTYDAVRCAFR